MPFTSSTFRMYPITGGNPDNDTDPLGGALDTASAWVEGSDSFTYSGAIPAAGSTTYYGLAGWYVDAGVTETLTGLKVALRTAMDTNAAAGQLGAVSTSAADTGILKIYGLVSSVVTVAELAMDGINSVFSSQTFDINSILWVEYTEDDAHTPPAGNITVSVGGQTLGVIFGFSSGFQVYQINSLVEIALASAVNTEIDWSGTNNRLTAPDTAVGTFSNAAYWTGNDASITAGYDITGGDYFQLCAKITLPAGLTLPPDSGLLEVAIMPFGTEV